MFESCSSEFLKEFYIFFIKEILLLLKKFQHRKAQKGIPDKIIFLKKFENDRLCEFKMVEFSNKFSNKAVEVTDATSD